ncbi:MAG: endonuclease III domain-containing protein [Candidatus Hodarchaeales archaeon]|jgi:endonuclease-3
MVRKKPPKVISHLTAEKIDEILTILSNASLELVDPLVTSITKKRRDPFQILIATILSLRTKDVITAEASKQLFSRADTPESILNLPIKDLEEIIYPVGFYKRKTETIRNICQRLINDYDGKVPDSLEELLSFKGVGRKTANLVITMGFGKPGICVDVHVGRITQRIGIVPIKGEKEGKPVLYDPDTVEMILREILPKKWWIPINDLLVRWGQNVCAPISPKCSKCIVSDNCLKIGVVKSR